MTSCPRPDKLRHHTPAAAWAHARALRRAGGSPDIKPYYCRDHQAWHVGHDPRSLRRRIHHALRKAA
jgi:hypothetical protein